MSGHMNAHIDGGAVRMHHREALRPIRLKHVSIFPHIGVENQNHVVLLGAVEQRLVHHAGVLNAPARVGARILGLGMLDRRQHHIDFAVAVGVRGDLPSRIPPLRKSAFNCSWLRAGGMPK